MSDNPLGGFDLNSLLETAQAMQSQLADAQEAQAAQLLTGSAGGGQVEVDVTGGGDYQAVRINPDVVDPDDVEMLNDLVLAALRDASKQIADLQEEALGGVTGGMDLGGLGGMLGSG
jgi:DNA-binding YbaB/EbfC family protein